jgi:hypothetical protein
MCEELKGKPPRDKEVAKPWPKYEKGVQSTFSTDICGITAAAFWANLHHKNNILFTISLYEIRQELENQVLNNPNDILLGTHWTSETKLQ